MEHDCGISLACPAWLCETFTNRKEIEIGIAELTEEIRKLVIEEKELNEQIDIVPTDEESFLGKLESEKAGSKKPSWGLDQAI